jgi:hypothetical protein
LPEPIRAEVESIVDAALYSVVQILDGVADPLIAGDLNLEFALIARLRDPDSDETVEELELAPDGEGLCIGYAGWVEGDFGATRGPKS